MESSDALDRGFGDQRDVPVYYSPRAIVGFSILMSTIFGAILMAMNLKNKNGQGQVIAFGILYFIISIVVVTYLKTNSGVTVGLNVVGGYILNTILWNKYIGKDTPYLPRSITTPIIVAVVITVVSIGLFFIALKILHY